MSDEVLTVRDIATEHRVSKKTVRNWIVDGVDGVKLKAYQIGRLYRIKRCWLDDFIERCGGETVVASDDPTPTEQSQRDLEIARSLDERGW